MKSALDFVDENLVHVARSRAWISSKQFRFDDAQTDQELLGSLIAHDQYADHYAGQPVKEQTHGSLHGPYKLALISVATFVPVTASKARARIAAWATTCANHDQAATDVELAHFLAHDLPAALIQSKVTIYELPDIRETAGHDWGWVVGRDGFHEFIAIDRSNVQLTLIVASDD